MYTAITAKAIHRRYQAYGGVEMRISGRVAVLRRGGLLLQTE